MEQKNQDMTSGSLAKGILFFSIPLMLSNILQVLFNMSDIAVVGHFAGAMALGSVCLGELTCWWHCIMGRKMSGA